MPIKYDGPKGDPKLGAESAQDLELLGQHITQWWGDAPEVFHEIASEYVHIDLHIVPASADRTHHTVITTGMSDRPMKFKGEDRYCELLLALPPEWPIKKESFVDEAVWWPFRHLKQTARFPHVYETFLWYGHTVANEDPPKPYHQTANFCGGILSIPMLCAEGARKLKIREKKEVFFFSFLPIFGPELRFAQQNGSSALFEKLDDLNVSELIRVNRKSAI